PSDTTSVVPYGGETDVVIADRESIYFVGDDLNIFRVDDREPTHVAGAKVSVDLLTAHEGVLAWHDGDAIVVFDTKTRRQTSRFPVPHVVNLALGERDVFAVTPAGDLLVFSLASSALRRRFANIRPDYETDAKGGKTFSGPLGDPRSDFKTYKDSLF